jgi:hypothetical protein
MSPRRAARVDTNQASIVDYLRARGASVQSLAAVGEGVPDLLVGYRGVNLLLEVKRPAGPQGGLDDRRLTPVQERWHAAWRGIVCVVRGTPDCALLLAEVER